MKSSYDELYLDGNIRLHRLLFEELLSKEPYNNYDFFALVNRYMKDSDIRSAMDNGDWRALNKCDKQLLKSIPLSGVPIRTLFSPIDKDDMIPAWWMGEIYCLLQWTYNIPSKVIAEKCPAEELYKLYNPLHETSCKRACEKIYEKYF